MKLAQAQMGWLLLARESAAYCFLLKAYPLHALWLCLEPLNDLLAGAVEVLKVKSPHAEPQQAWVVSAQLLRLAPPWESQDLAWLLQDCWPAEQLMGLAQQLLTPAYLYSLSEAPQCLLILGALPGSMLYCEPLGHWLPLPCVLPVELQLHQACFLDREPKALQAQEMPSGVPVIPPRVVQRSWAARIQLPWALAQQRQLPPAARARVVQIVPPGCLSAARTRRPAPHEKQSSENTCTADSYQRY